METNTVVLDATKIESNMLQMARDERKAGRIAKSIFDLARKALKDGKNFHAIDKATLPAMAGNDYCLEQICAKLQRRCDASQLKVAMVNEQMMFTTTAGYMSYLNGLDVQSKQIAQTSEVKNGTVKA